MCYWLFLAVIAASLVFNLGSRGAVARTGTVVPASPSKTSSCACITIDGASRRRTATSVRPSNAEIGLRLRRSVRRPEK
jgi:hypothetical protein